MRRLLLLAVLLLVPATVWAQGNTNTLPPACTATSLGNGSCAPATQGMIVRVTDAASATVCTGGGSTVVTCQYSGSAWGPMATVVATGGTWTGANGETITNATESQIELTMDENGSLTLLAVDTATPAHLVIDTTGNGSIVLGSIDVDRQVYITDGVQLEVDTNGTNTLSLENNTTGSVILDFRDYKDTTDDDMAHVSLTVDCGTATTGAEDCDLVIATTEAGSNVNRVSIVGDGDTILYPLRNDGGNGDGLTANPQSRINGIPKIAPFAVVGKVNTNTVSTDFIDETPVGEWTGAGTVTEATESTVIRMGAGSLSLAYATGLAAGNGADNPLGSGDQDWSADESFGLWHRCDFTYDASDLVLGVTDAASEDATTGFPAYGTANKWVWTELEIGSIADADKNIITDISFDLSTAGVATAEAAITAAGGPVNCYFDYAFKWDAAEEIALGLDIYEDGLLGVFSIVTGTGADRAPIIEVEGTDYLVHYETGVDFLIPITDLSADNLWGMGALE